MDISAHKGSGRVLFVAAVLFIGSNVYYSWYEWTPVHLPIVKLGDQVTGSFKADFEATYHAIIVFDHKSRPRYWECVYGAEITPSECNSVREIATVKWSLEGDGIQGSGEAKGHGRGAVLGNGYAGSRITIIPAKKGGSYTITASLEGPDGILEETRPRIKVEAPALLHKGYAVWSGIISLAAYVFAGAALVLFVAELWKRYGSNQEN